MMNLHPLFVHFPIALLLAALFFEVVARVKPQAGFREAAFWSLILGVLGFSVAVGTGLWAEETIAHNEVIHEMMELHEHLHLIAGSLFLVALVWRFRIWEKDPKKVTPLAFVVLLFIATAVMGYSAAIGGRMVFEQGAGTSIPGLEMGEGHHHHGAHEEDADHDHDHEAAAEGTGTVHVHKDGTSHVH